MLANKVTIAQLLAVPIYLWLINYIQGPKELSSEQPHAILALLAFLIPSLVLVLVFAIFAVFQVRKEEAKMGEWFGSKFSYKEPVLLSFDNVSSIDNDKIKEFSIGPAELGYGIELYLEIGGFEKRAKIFFFDSRESAEKANLSDSWYQYGPITVLTWASKRHLYYKTFCKTINPSEVRVLLRACNVGGNRILG